MTAQASQADKSAAKTNMATLKALVPKFERVATRPEYGREVRAPAGGNAIAVQWAIDIIEANNLA